MMVYGYGQFCKALREQDWLCAAALGEDWDSGLTTLAHALAARMAPFLRAVFYRATMDSPAVDAGAFVVAPLPAALLSAGGALEAVRPDLRGFFEAVDDAATRYAGVIVADAGHSWGLLLEDFERAAPFLCAAPQSVVCLRIDLAGRTPSETEALRGAGDVVERALRAAAASAGLPFAVIHPGAPAEGRNDVRRA